MYHQVMMTTSSSAANCDARVTRLTIAVGMSARETIVQSCYTPLKGVALGDFGDEIVGNIPSREGRR